mgnify:CR=1 FL=1
MNRPLKKWHAIFLMIVVFGLSVPLNASAVVNEMTNNETFKNTTTTKIISANQSAAPNLKPFRANSLNQITAKRAGHAFIMVLWSIDCPPCLKEFEYYQALKAQFTNTNIVLISTDSPDDSALIEQVLFDHQLQTIDSWIFSDSLPERLRYKIDPNWYGELPRTYFYDADHQRKAHSGMVTQTQLQQWLQKHTPLVSLK